MELLKCLGCQLSAIGQANTTQFSAARGGGWQCFISVWGSARGSSSGSRFDGKAELFNHGVGQDLAGHFFDLGVGLLFRQTAGQRYLKKLPLADVAEPLVAHLLECALNRLTLGIEDSFLQRNVNVSFHGDRLIIRQRVWGVAGNSRAPGYLRATKAELNSNLVRADSCKFLISCKFKEANFRTPTALDSFPVPSSNFGVNEGEDAPAVLASQADPPAGPWIENPPWTGFDLLLLTCVVVFGIFFFTSISVGILHGIYGKPLAELAGDPSVWMVVPAEGAAYMVMFAVLYWLAGSRHLHFWRSLSWNWPEGFGWAGFLLIGFTLAFVAGALQKVLPLPKELPIEKLFLQPGAPQVLALFGVMVAPFVEETFFRGLLYPVANRWLREVVSSEERLRRGRLLFLCLVPWGFVAQWRQPLGWMLLGMAAMIGTGIVCFRRGLEGVGAEAVRPILAGLAFFSWALVAAHVSRVFLMAASFVLLGVVVVMTILELKLRAGRVATGVGIACSFVITAASFTLLHGSQLGGSWSPLLVLLVTSSVLTFARARTKSLATSVIIHVGYNGALFGSMYFATDHFRHIEHLTR
jgi:membrane protease YdiL (CAAX protease family)